MRRKLRIVAGVLFLAALVATGAAESAYSTDSAPETKHILQQGEVTWVDGEHLSLDPGAYIVEVQLSNGRKDYLRFSKQPKIDEQHPITWFEQNGYAEQVSHQVNVPRDVRWIHIDVWVMALMATLFLATFIPRRRRAAAA